jgi:TPR repeat protein
MRRLVLATTLVLGVIASAGADYQEGISAYMRGDYGRALEVFLPLAREGHAEAQYTLGYMFAFGLGVSKRQAAAAHWYRRAAQQGHVKAQVNLGVLYQEGQGVERDYGQALQWYRRAAAQGSAKGQYALGVMYREGLGVPRDYVQAHMWYDLAAAQNLGIANDERDAVAQDMTLRQVDKAEQLAAQWKERHQMPKAAQ